MERFLCDQEPTDLEARRVGYSLRASFAEDLDGAAVRDAHEQPGEIGAQCSTAESCEN